MVLTTTARRKYRRSDAIIAAILESATAGAVSKTRIMYGAYLSYYQASSYLHELCVETLLTEDDESHFSITERGRKWLEFHRMQSDLGIELTV